MTNEGTGVDPRFTGESGDGHVQFVQGMLGLGVVLLEQGFGAVAGGPQLRYAAITGGTMQSVHTLDQGVVVVGVTRNGDGESVGLQGGEQHGEHVRRQIRLTGGQAQAFFMVKHRQLYAGAEAIRYAFRALIAQGQAGPLQYHLSQLPLADGFGQVIVHAALQQGAFFVGHGVGGEGDHWQWRAAAFAFPLADRLGALAAIHAGHLYVHQHQVEGVLFHGVDGGITAFHGTHPRAHVFQQGLYQQQVRRIVIHAQYARRTAGQRFARFTARRTRADQVGQRTAQFARARRFGLQLAVGVGHGLVEQHLLGGGAQHQHFAAQVFEVPQVLVEALGRDVVGRHAEHRQVDGLFGLMGAGDAVGQTFQAIERGDFQAAVFQLMLQRLACQFMVFQHGDAMTQQGRGRQVFDVVAGLGQVQADPEFRTFARRAVDADFAAHLLDQALGNHQAQPRAAGLARQRVVGLAEGLEQRAHVLAGQADTGVLHADAQLHAVLLFVLDHCPGHDGALAGELDRVADQVGEDLLQAQRVADQRQRRVAVHQAHQFQLFGMGGGCEDGQGVLQQVPKVERDAVEHQLAGFDFREIEDLVDDAQQVVGGLFDGAQVVKLAWGQLAFLQ